MNINKNIFESMKLGLKILSVLEKVYVIREKVASDTKNIAKDVLGLSKGKSFKSKNS